MITHIDACYQGKLDRKLTLELDIIRNLSRDHNEKTAYVLHLDLSKDYSDITKAIHRLHDKEYLSSRCKICDEIIFSNKDWKKHEKSTNHKLNKKKMKKSDRTTGRTKRFVKLTINGFKTAIIDSSKIEVDYELIENQNESKNLKWEPITSKLFWKYVYDNYTNMDSESLLELTKLFENHILKVQREYHLPTNFFNNIHDKDKILNYKKIINNKIKSILITISKNKPFTTKQLLKKLPEIKENDIMSLFHLGLISNIDDLFELTSLGLLELLFYIYSESNNELVLKRLDNDNKLKIVNYQNVSKSNDSYAKKITRELESIRIKYSFLLPHIFNGGNLEKLGISFYEVVILLMKLYKNLKEPKIGDNHKQLDKYSEEFQTLQKLDQIRQQSYHRKYNEYYNKGFELINENSGYDKDDLVLPMIIEVIDHENYSSLNKFFSEFDTKEKDSIWSDTQQRHENLIMGKITFDFYSIYKTYCQGWENSKLEDSKIRKWHDKECESLTNFSKNHIKIIEKEITK